MYYEYYVRTPQNKIWLFVLPGYYEFDIMTKDANERRTTLSQETKSLLRKSFS